MERFRSIKLKAEFEVAGKKFYWREALTLSITVALVCSGVIFIYSIVARSNGWIEDPDARYAVFTKTVRIESDTYNKGDFRKITLEDDLALCFEYQTSGMCYPTKRALDIFNQYKSSPIEEKGRFENEFKKPVDLFLVEKDFSVTFSDGKTFNLKKGGRLEIRGFDNGGNMCLKLPTQGQCYSYESFYKNYGKTERNSVGKYFFVFSKPATFDNGSFQKEQKVEVRKSFSNKWIVCLIDGNKNACCPTKEFAKAFGQDANTAIEDFVTAETRRHLVTMPSFILFSSIGAGLFVFFPTSIIRKRVTVGRLRKELDRTLKQEGAEMFREKFTEVSTALEKELTSLNSYTGEIGVSWDLEHYRRILNQARNDFSAKHKSDLHNVIDKFTDFADSKLSGIRADLKNLEKSSRLYKDAVSIHAYNAKKVNKSLSPSLIVEMDLAFYGLTSPELKELLPERKWEQFNEIVNAIIEDFQRLGQQGEDYDSNIADSYEAEEEEEAENGESKIDEEKAFRIMGIPATSTNEQIKKVYRQLAAIYHPDVSVVKDDEKFKEVNEAYEFLKEVRNIR